MKYLVLVRECSDWTNYDSVNCPPRTIYVVISDMLKI